MEINKKVIVFLLVMTFLPLLSFFSYFWYQNLTDKRTFQQIVLDDRSNRNYSFKVKEIYRDNRNHNVLTLRGENKQTDVAGVEPIWENGFFEIGDSVSKKKGQLEIYVFRNDSLKFKLDYKEIKYSKK
ncbi:hypothetical protein IF125_14075 [Empedobacter stercoris]|uniref:hypothetical protein n=1 Tax=Empedobacter stercoris TaxID=1628248 RepID=UPI001CE19797|nr:hypothetical protein [Empedobacter stercoris]MCA4783362.1 hypothetical protein [Empedobacter stercoris]